MRVTMLVKSEVLHDARVVREATSLASAGHDVTVVGDEEPGSGSAPLGVTVRWVRGPSGGSGGVSGAATRSSLPRWLRWLGLPTHRRRAVRAFERRALEVAGDIPVDVVHAHDLSALTAAAALADRTGAALVYDAHECWTGRRLEGRPEPLGQWLDRRRERRLGRRASHVLTVSEGLAAWLQNTYGWESVTVVRNSFPILERTRSADVSSPPVAVVYAGRIDAKRDLLTAVEALDGGPLRLELIGPGDEAHRAELVAAGAVVEGLLPVDAIDDRYRAAGLALVPLTDDQFNHRIALPNKVFHAVRAGVPVVAADLPELRQIVLHYDLGELYRPGDASALQAAVERAIGRHDELLVSVAAAQPALTWPADERALLGVYEALESR